MVVLTKTVFDLLGEPVTWAELLGFVTGIACVVLAVAQRIETFPIGIANNVFFVVLFVDAPVRRRGAAGRLHPLRAGRPARRRAPARLDDAALPRPPPR